MPSLFSSFLHAAERCHTAALNLLYPKICPHCKVVLADSRRRPVALCRACRNKLEPIRHPFCQCCGEPFAGALPAAFSCSNCRAREFSFDFAIAGCRYTHAARTLVQDFKYGGRTSLRHALGELLARTLDDPRILARSGWILQPVPLHARRQRERGFNQAEELCRHLRASCGLPVANALRRRRYTSTQARLDRRERRQNLNGAFCLTRRASRWELHKHPVLLVDDVFTTGSTAQECARVLKEDARVPFVAVITVARG